jgi:hypothetical protein
MSGEEMKADRFTALQAPALPIMHKRVVDIKNESTFVPNIRTINSDEIEETASPPLTNDVEKSKKTGCVIS